MEARALALSFNIGVRTALLVFSALFLAGCNPGPAKGTVKGAVTLDGEPVDGGVITFVPADGKSQPEAVLITAGEYTVTMPLGEKRVEIYWAASGGQSADTASQGREQIVQRIPVHYNSQSTLSHTVTKGEARKRFCVDEIARDGLKIAEAAGVRAKPPERVTTPTARRSVLGPNSP